MGKEGKKSLKSLDDFASEIGIWIGNLDQASKQGVCLTALQ